MKDWLAIIGGVLLILGMFALVGYKLYLVVTGHAVAVW